ncbi:MAG: Aerobic cobaltochelatase subunit CobT [Alphaproteobacteria bacterium MarineAlpha6_Bin4]|nr:MAG: Aerobic cobaltochelatase subunit CobT [Alphaproteobacteria bacterium MarineAlpha6_Bin4]|tara:strand:+ start:8237 stop:9994 length:1758 start_codon:yes stop_codon:yes gene_type:complete
MSDFNKSIASTIKSISEKKNLIFSFNNKITKIEGNKIFLPVSDLSKKNFNIKNYRGVTDFLALKLKYHDFKIYKNFKPKEIVNEEIFDALEETRIITLGSYYMKGIAYNLKASIEFFCKKNQFNKIKKRDNSQITQIIKLVTSEFFLKEKLPKNTYSFMNLWKPILMPIISKDLVGLKKEIMNQNEYSKKSLKLIKKINKFCKKKNEFEKKTIKQKKEEKLEKKHKNIEEKTNNSSFFNNESNNIKKEVKEKIENKKNKINKKVNFLNNSIFKLNEDLKYKVYTNKFDKIVRAEEYCKRNELLQLHNQLLKDSKETSLTVKRLAKKLQNKLLVFNKSFWNFDLEEGKINNAKLARVIADNSYKKIYKNFEEKKIKDTVVTLLIDNSGSMRGKPIQTAAICSKIISKILENCSVKVEVLGFTTREWKGGKSREHWIEKDMPNNPGRLNDLIHIIYKTPEDNLKKINQNFALMLKDGLLKENIDGESLLWALSRIWKRNEERKILMIISDGAPVDDSTISANSANYLEKHLKKVIKFIENKTEVEIIAIGIGHNVNKYYKKAVTINDPDQLGGTMIKNFLELFDKKK